MDSRSSDNLDEVLCDYSNVFQSVKKWDWDRSKSVVNNPFGCPAERYNILVKLCSHDILWKTDPEMVILDPLFLQKAIDLVNEKQDRFVMPFPYHCYEFPISNMESIKDNYLKSHYPTHITKDNAKYELVYYMSVFRKESYIRLGGIDERFTNFIGSEDNHFLDFWKKKYGIDSFIPMLDSPVIHLWHGGMASGPQGVPSHLYGYVNQGAKLREELKDTPPNLDLTWGRLYSHLTLTSWEKGKCKVNKIPISEARPDLVIFGSR
jgi:hypothetical protein